MTVFNQLDRNLLVNVLSFLAPTEKPTRCLEAVALAQTSRAGAHIARLFCIFAEEWQKRVVRPLVQIRSQLGTFFDERTQVLFLKHASFRPLNRHSAFSGVRHISYVSDELATGSYNAYEKQLILRHVFQMTAPLPAPGEERSMHPSLQKFAGGLTGAETIEPMPKYPKVGLIREGDEWVAKILLPKKKYPGLAGERCDRTTLNICCAAYELMDAFGSCSVAPTHRIQGGAVLQQYISKSVTLDELMRKDERGAEKLMSICPLELHLHAMLSIARGRDDGHTENSVIACDEASRWHIYDIDEEQSFFADGLSVVFSGEEIFGPLHPHIGLPQGSRPLSKAVLKLFSWYGCKEKSAAIVNKYYIKDVNSMVESMDRRWDKIRALCSASSVEEQPTHTVRDIYAAVYGRDYYVQKLGQLGFSTYAIFSKEIFGVDASRVKPTLPARTVLHRNLCDLERQEKAYKPIFPMAGPKKEKFPGKELIFYLHDQLWEEEALDCVEILEGAFNRERYEFYLKNYPNAPCAMHSFLLSDCLEGFAKRFARQCSVLFPACPLEVTEHEGGALWLTMHSDPIVLGFAEKLYYDQPEYPLRVMEIPAHEFAHKRWQDAKRKSPQKDIPFVNYLSGQAKTLFAWFETIWVYDGSFTVEQNGERFFLTFYRSSKEARTE